MSLAVGFSDQFTADAIKSASIAYPPLFISRYFKDDKGQPIKLKPFHIEWIEAMLDPAIDKLLILAPAFHAKTTVTRFICTYLMSRDPNVRIMHIMNNSTDAEQNLSAIQVSMEEHDSELVSDFGPFRGRKWTTTQMELAKRTITDKEPTFAAYGTGSNVFGHRADFVICDDLLNLDNSGPQATDAMRQKVHDWFFQGVMKVAAPRGKVIVIGTMMDFRDLYHELLDPKHGFKVIRMQALIDDETREVLWPEQMPYEKLVAMRESDPVSFMKRMQNEALDESSLVFPQAALDACCEDRPWGVVTQAMKDAGRTHVIVSFDPSSGQKTGWCGLAVLAFNPKEPEPRQYDVLEIYNFRRMLESSDEEESQGKLGQVETLIQAVTKYGARMLVIEKNGAHQYLLQSKKLRAFRDSGHRVEPHYTSGRDKADPDIGVDTLGPLVSARKITFPFGDEESRRWVSSFFTQEASKYPMASRTDRLMALWMGFLKARELGARNQRIRRRSLPSWMQNAGLFQRAS